MSDSGTSGGYKEPSRAIFAQRDLRHFLGSPVRAAFPSACVSCPLWRLSWRCEGVFN
jgi:hypothetical protein